MTGEAVSGADDEVSEREIKRGGIMWIVFSILLVLIGVVIYFVRNLFVLKKSLGIRKTSQKR